MYALLELADRVRCRGIGSLFEVENIHEYPDNKVRGVDRFVMGHRDDEWFYSEDFWVSFIQRMAKTGLTALPLLQALTQPTCRRRIPSLWKFCFLPLRLKTWLPAGGKRTLRCLSLSGKRASLTASEFFFATWQQQPWTDNQKFLVENIPWMMKSLLVLHRRNAELLLSCPEIDGIQLRVNFEAGIRSTGDKPTNTHERFWLADRFHCFGGQGL